MKASTMKGFSFGLTSSIITTLGLIMGLYSGTHSKLIVMGGIIVISIADSLSDSVGIHISEEAEGKHTVRQVWESTISTFIFHFLFALSFIIPMLLLNLDTAVIVSIIYGLLLISGFSYYISRENKVKAYKVVAEHLIITIFVILITHYIGSWIYTL